MKKRILPFFGRQDWGILLAFLALLLALGLPGAAFAADLDGDGRRNDGVSAPPGSDLTVPTGAYYEAICLNPADQREIRWIKVTPDFAVAQCWNKNNGNTGNNVKFTCANDAAMPEVRVYDSYLDPDGNIQRYGGVGGLFCVTRGIP
jgi:hypothetical protein